MSSDLEFQVAKLEAKPGDILVFTTQRVLTEAAAQRIRETIMRLVPSARALVCDGGAEISLMPADELRKRLGEGGVA